ncbi:MAG: hypothetical protein IPJ13_01460 [Saprospiraceae bacterium]|nr:hypothetical protein [Saprospiraceae bacterium]
MINASVAGKLSEESYDAQGVFVIGSDVIHRWPHILVYRILCKRSSTFGGICCLNGLK